MAKGKSFELYKYYEHTGGSRYHIIAIARKSDMWIISETGMAVAECREGNLHPVGTDPTSAVNWYEINKDIFRNDVRFEQINITVANDPPKDIPLDLYEITLKHDYILRVYKNGFILLYDKVGYYDDRGVIENLSNNDPAKVLEILKDQISDEQLIAIEKLLFSRI
jgi:hypothetical protein